MLCFSVPCLLSSPPPLSPFAICFFVLVVWIDEECSMREGGVCVCFFVCTHRMICV